MSYTDKYGICALSIVPVRTEPSDKSELSTQLLFGDAYEPLALSENGRWLQIRTRYEGYEGWIDLKQHNAVEEQFWNRLENEQPVYTSGPVNTLVAQDGILLLAAGSRLPCFAGNHVQVSEALYAYTGNTVAPVKKATADMVVSTALSYINTPYLWGGKTHFGIDCSGLVQQVFKVCGYKLERDAWQQALAGTKVQLVEETKAGDLAFFSNAGGRVVHVGVMMEGQRIIHAHGRVRIDILDETGIYNEKDRYHSHRLSAIKRIL
jgi:gamma-D-glutamyl-L-lysine dipeptidyl-peptidase